MVTAKITSKGQITIPVEVRKALGLHPGDQLIFESCDGEARVRPLREQGVFAKYCGIADTGIGLEANSGSTRAAICRWMRGIRGDEYGGE